MKKKTGLILAAVGAGAGFLAGRFVEKIITAKDLVDRIEDMGGSDDLEDYLYDRYGENSGEDEDEDDEKCPDCGKSPCECKKKNLKEAMIYSARYARGEKTSVLTEETRILCEDIKNNSASKYLSKLSKKAEKEAAKASK